MIFWGLLLVLLYLFYRWATNNDNKWDGTGVKVLKPTIPLLGSDPSFLFKGDSVPYRFMKRYEQMKEYPYYVFYFFKEDVVQILDPKVIKDICIRNFDHFTDRVVFDIVLKTHPEQRKFLINLKGEEWKILRNSLSPTFTTEKLRNILGSIESCGPTFVDHIRVENKKNNNGPLQMLGTYRRYAMSVIANGVFGVDAEAYNMDEESEFVKTSKAFQVKFELGLIVRFFFLMFFPRFCEFIGFRLVKKSSYFTDLTRAAMDHRRGQNHQQNDMLKLLVDLQDNAKESNKHNLSQDSTSTTEEDTRFEADAKLSGVTKAAVIDEETVTQSAVLFLVAGLDTVSHTLSIISYHLAMNPDVQERARQEVDDIAAVLESGKISYDDIKKMEYLDMVVSESLRITPIVSSLERVCTKDYKLPCGAVIPKDTRVIIPIIGIQNDERYWEAPNKFLPERFSKENKNKIIHGTYLPFGLGPRNCIGMRFALMEVKVALYSILRNFVIKPSDKTPDPIRFAPSTIFSDVEGSNWLHLVPREEIN